MAITIPYSYNGVAGSTLLRTLSGPIAISTLVDQTVTVWNGIGWDTVVVKLVQTSQPLYLVTLTDGRTLQCSDGYRWYIQQASFAQFFEIKTKALHLNPAIWWTTLDTDPDGRSATTFPTIASVVPAALPGDIYCAVGCVTGLMVVNGILSSAGSLPE